MPDGPIKSHLPVTHNYLKEKINYYSKLGILSWLDTMPF